MITKETQETLDFLESIIGKKPSLGDYILSIRKGEEVSQVELAKTLGISRQNLCDIEHNRRFVSPKMAADFAPPTGNSQEGVPLTETEIQRLKSLGYVGSRKD